MGILFPSFMDVDFSGCLSLRWRRRSAGADPQDFIVFSGLPSVIESLRDGRGFCDIKLREGVLVYLKDKIHVGGELTEKWSQILGVCRESRGRDRLDAFGSRSFLEPPE